MHLLPDALENLTMKEFYLLLDGHYARKKEEDYKQAYFTYWMLAPNLGRESKITVDDIFNPLHQDMVKDKESEKEELLRTFNF